jgi:uncharacterized protein YjiS (DUF1127 family)
MAPTGSSSPGGRYDSGPCNLHHHSITIVKTSQTAESGASLQNRFCIFFYQHLINLWRVHCDLRIGAMRHHLFSYNAVQHIFTSRNQAGRNEPANAQTDEKDHIMNIARSFNNWRKYRETVNELDRMSNRELGDLGITRESIRSVARAAVR